MEKQREEDTEVTKWTGKKEKMKVFVANGNAKFDVGEIEYKLFLAILKILTVKLPEAYKRR